MAEGTVLKLEFLTAEEKTTTFTFKYAKPSVTAAQVKTLMETMISNKEIFETEPAFIKSAKTVTTSETVYDLSDLTAMPYYEAIARGVIGIETDTDIPAFTRYLEENPAMKQAYDERLQAAAASTPTITTKSTLQAK